VPQECAIIDTRGTSCRSQIKRSAASSCREQSAARPSGVCAPAGSVISGYGSDSPKPWKSSPRRESRQHTGRRARIFRRSGARSRVPTQTSRHGHRGPCSRAVLRPALPGR
jgi:hypothetical protein